MADAETGAAPGAAPAAAPDDARPGETRAQASARLRREKREAARKKREKKMREAEYHGKEEEPAAVAEEKRATGAWADDGCGGFPPLFGMCHADRLYVEDDPFPDPESFLLAPPPEPPPPPPPAAVDEGTGIGILPQVSSGSLGSPPPSADGREVYLFS